MLAAVTPLPVIGVPVPLKYLDGMDSLLSIVQMPAGVPVATVAIGNARNAGLLAVRILAAADPALQQKMLDFQSELRDSAHSKGRSSAARRSTSSASDREGGTAHPWTIPGQCRIVPQTRQVGRLWPRPQPRGISGPVSL